MVLHGNLELHIERQSGGNGKHEYLQKNFPHVNILLKDNLLFKNDNIS